MNLARLRRLALGVALAASIGPGLIGTARALELKGSTYFTSPPWKVDLVSYYTTIWQPFAEYFFTISLDADAGAALGGLTIQQTRGVDNRFPFAVERTEAFLGRPRQRGQRLPNLTLLQGSSASPFLNQFPPAPPSPWCSGPGTTHPLQTPTCSR
jgi:hypothetical protein